jgi:hypothetical protein
VSWHADAFSHPALGTEWDRLIDRAIAIVVERVAELGSRSYCTGAPRCALVAYENPRRAFTHARAARRAHRKPVIDDAVAIIIEHIADLCDRPSSTLTGQHSIHAAGRTRRTLTCIVTTGCPCPRIAFIDERVAIIVESIAALRPRAAFTHARQRPADTNLAPELAFTGFRVTTLTAALWISLIHDAITVVVGRIAQLSHRFDRSCARNRSRSTLGRSRSTRTGSATARDTASRISFVDAGVTVVVDSVTDFSSRRAITDARHRATDATHHTRAARSTRGSSRDIVIDEAITVVVHTIADLGHWSLASDTHLRSCSAHESPWPARTDGTATSSTSARVALVRVAIAVIVGCVADLRSRSDRTHASAERPRRTCLDSLLARAHRDSARACHSVDDTVAVIIHTIAGLGRRSATTAHTPRPVRTDFDAARALAHIDPARTREVLIDPSIAVIVRAVARLGLWTTDQTNVVLVRNVVAVIVHPIADFDRSRATRAALIEQSLIGSPVTVVVDTVANDLSRIRAEAERVDARWPIAEKDESFVNERVAVVVDTIANLSEDRVVDDLRDRRREGGRIIDEDRRSRPTRVGNRIELRRCAGRIRESDHVSGIPRSTKRRSRRAGITAARLSAIRKKNDAIRSTRAAHILSANCIEIAPRGGQTSRKRCRARTSQFDVEAGRSLSEIVRAPIEPFEQVVFVLR